MKASEAIVKCLQEENVDIVFGYPGAAVVPIYEELRKSNIQHILVRHEQGAGHCASGYARATGKVGVCMVTSGPGATNVITAVATAYMDSIPLVIITGQVNTYQIGKDVFQEADITGSTEPFTKHNYLIKDEKDIPRIMKEAFYIARTGRPGPVLIDIPMDLQNKEIDFDYSMDINIRGYKPTTVGHTLQIKKIVEKLNNCQRPLVCVGGGVACSNAREELRAFLQLSKIPVVHTLMGKDSVPSDYDYYLGMIGMHGIPIANKAVSKADVILNIGSRFGDRAINPFTNGCAKEIIHIDIDPAEIGKNLNSLIPVVGDAKDILSQLNSMIEPLKIEDWLQEVKELKEKDWTNEESNNDNNITKGLNPKEAVKFMSSNCDDDTILVSDVGQNQMWASRHFDIIKNRLCFTSGGLGTMGYSLPAAIGAKLACPDRTVIVTVGDGAFQMSLQELGTIANYNVNLIIVVFNNNGLGMVRELQNKIYKNTYGVDIEYNPDFTKIAEAYGLNWRKVYSNSEFNEAFLFAKEQQKTTLIECIVDSKVRTLL
ncbi:MAG: biosynthetic-type acetolactate synthase large subunit [Clostridiales bacterium]|uniref:biosynthetic-type acetolactate synthase large subunit n=1 Tax=Clostridium sp. N3C TaxID=1776758 RepID=UPI00092DF386|nr:biosynthetic-type acetolactate synthase large subunit [Clostridium sp. N3C]NLZ47431.1 biosynthetic-type acetolactate synthase large subunit [Clostridiales bacterium]SCN26113.1 Acetolactate synthase large subunit [Clostridium sp. N3C]